MTDYNVGDNVTYNSPQALGRRPAWLEWSSTNLAGSAQLPSGHRQVRYLGPRTTTWPNVTHDVNVLPVSLPATAAPWRCAVYKGDGAYCVMDGLTGTPTVGTPTVRLTADGPAKATVSLPIITPGGLPTSSSFSGWSDGSSAAIARGMEMTVEYRNTAGDLALVFRGIVYQVDRGDTITLTAYDRLMDLVQYSDQYQSTTGLQTDAPSFDRTISGTTYTYDMGTEVGTLVACEAYNTLTMDSLPVQTEYNSQMVPGFAHEMPTAAGVTVSAGDTINSLAVKVYGGFTIPDSSNTLHARFYLLKASGSGLATVQTSSEVTYSANAVEMDNVTLQATGLGWAVSSGYLIGAYIWATTNASGSSAFCTFKASTTRYTTANATYYQSINGTSWSVTSYTDLPEIAVTFIHLGDSITLGNLTVSGTTVSVDSSNIPYTTGTYLTLDDLGTGILLDFYPVSAVSLATLASDLITWAGLTPDVSSAVDGYTSYYTTSTYDYLTCVNELIRASNCMAVADTDEAGIVHVLPRHTIDETPARTVGTDPGTNAEQIVVSHDLTAHWMASKATVAYLAEDATTSGLPVALETDDALMDGSLVEALGSPLRQVVADRSLGTHALQANAAGGKIVQLHTNVFEGTMVLAGYQTDLWDSGGAYAGGVPLGVDIPEAGISGTAVPTQIILHDGVTEVSLDNIRTADRSEVAVSMGLTADAISNSSGELPSTVYIFARADSPSTQAGKELITPTAVHLYYRGIVATQNDGAYIKTATDAAGYHHVVAIFPTSQAGYSPDDAIYSVMVDYSGGTLLTIMDNPKPALPGQAVHVDVRYKAA